MGEFVSSADLRKEIVRGCKVLSRFRIVEGFGHISARLPGDRMIITPRKALGLVTENELVEMDFAGNQFAGDGRPPLEFSMHIAVYKARADVMSISRGHPRNVAAFASAGQDLRIGHGFGANLGAVVKVSTKPYLVTNPEMGGEIASLLTEAEAVILQSNGMLAVGTTVGHACVMALFLEETAELQLKAVAAGMVPKYYDPASAARRHSDDKVHEPIRAWEYYVGVTEGAIGI